MPLLCHPWLFPTRSLPRSSPQQQMAFCINYTIYEIVQEKGIIDSWKEYMEKLMNEENKWDHRISAGVKEGPAYCIRIGEVAAALKNIKRYKAPGLSVL